MPSSGAYRSRRHHWLSSASLVGIAAILASSPAFAQDENADEAVSEVVITGSRTIRDGSQAPTPVAVVSVEQLQAATPKNLGEALQALPALRGTSSSNSTNQSARINFTGTFLNLRNLGPQRTLVLLDGRRVAPASSEGTVNFNNLPQSLIKRVDIVTGGASAAYGSDAVAGVVNVILDDEFKGLKGLVQGGIGDTGDVGNYKAELTAGGDLLDGRLRWVASGGVSRANRQSSLQGKDWIRNGRYESMRTFQFVANTPGSVPQITVPVANGGLAAYYNTEGLVRINYPGGLITTASNSALVNTAFNLSAKTNYSTAGVPGVQGQGYKFLPNGEGSPYDTGILSTTIQQKGGDGIPTMLGATALLETSQAFGRVTFDVTDRLTLYSEGAFSFAHNNFFLAINAIVTGANSLAIFEDNYYLQRTTPDAYARLTGITRTTANATAYDAWAGVGGTCPVLAQNAATPIRCFRMGKIFTDIPQVYGDIGTDSFNWTTGFNLEISDAWRASGYYNRGYTLTTIMTPGSQYLQRMYAAVDTIANPATATATLTPVAGVAAGAPVCRILAGNNVSAAIKAKYAGCKPANMFGVGNVDPASYEWFLQSPKFDIEIEQEVYAADIAGEPFQLPAGPLAVALGLEHRVLSTKLIGGEPLSNEIRQADSIRGYPPGNVGQEGVFSFTNQSGYGGESVVNEAYVEVNVPVIKDLPLIADLGLNGAYRYTDYSSSGPVKTWKVGVSYKPVESLRFRGTLSHDIRAPAISELFQGNVTAGFPFNDIAQTPPVTNAPNAPRTVARGNPNLVPEEADTLTYGVVFTPTWIPGLTVSLDYYDITIEDSIVLQNGNDPIVDCVTFRIQAGCDAIRREGGQATPLGGSSGPLNNIQTVVVTFLNQAVFQTQGWDVEMSYRRGFEAIPGFFTLRTIWGYVDENYVINRSGDLKVNQAGDVAVNSNAGSNPRFRASTVLSWENAGFMAQVTQRFTSSAKGANYLSIPTVPFVEGVNIDNNRVPSYQLWDLFFRYQFGENQNYEAFLSINNALDKEPPLRTAWSGVYITNNALYDTVGRTYVTGLKFRF